MEISTKLPACKDCYKRLISNLKENTNEKQECNNCLCWNINPNDPKQQIMKVPNNIRNTKRFLREIPDNIRNTKRFLREMVLGCSLQLGASLGGST
jgi:hypothetical protein